MIKIPAGNREVVVSEAELAAVLGGWMPYTTDSPLRELHEHDDGGLCCDPDPLCQVDPDLHCSKACEDLCADSGELLFDPDDPPQPYDPLQPCLPI